jgi:hypothetical protein
VVREEHQQPARNAGPARLKGAIDEGRTRDKVPGFDPGAAPLGTDEESGGAPLSRDAGRRASMEPGAVTEAAADPKGNDRSRYRLQDRMVWPVIAGLISIAAAAALVAGLLF